MQAFLACGPRSLMDVAKKGDPIKTLEQVWDEMNSVWDLPGRGRRASAAVLVWMAEQSRQANILVNCTQACRGKGWQSVLDAHMNVSHTVTEHI